MSDEPRPVEVLHDGRWIRGRLLGWTRRDEHGTWWGIVRYTAGVGQQYEHARPQTEIRPAGR